MGMNLDAKFQETDTQFEADFGELLKIKGEKGDTGSKGDKGDPGYTPVRGKDYWTDADKEEIDSSVDAKLANYLTRDEANAGVANIHQNLTENYYTKLGTEECIQRYVDEAILGGAW